MELDFIVNNQIVTRTDKNKAVNMSEGYLTLIFHFETNDWNDLEDYYIYFKAGDGDYKFQLENATGEGLVKKVTVPSIVLTGRKFIFGLYGLDDNGVIRITTNLSMVKLLDSKFTDGGVAVIERLEALETLIVKKVDKITGKGLSTNDFTDTYKALIDSFDGDFTELVEAHLEDVIDDLTNDAFYTKPEVNALVNNRLSATSNEDIVEAEGTLEFYATFIKNGVPLPDKTITFYKVED